MSKDQDIFKDIKVGDKVLCEVELRCGFTSLGYFNVRVACTKVTPKRFEVNGKVYSKADGCRIGGYGRVSPIGCEETKDQTEEYIKARDSLRVGIELQDIAIDLYKKDLEGLCENPNLEEVYKMMVRAQQLLGNNDD